MAAKEQQFVWLVHFRCQAIDNVSDIPFDPDNWQVFSTEEAAEKFSKKWDKENTCYTWSEITKLKYGG